MNQSFDQLTWYFYYGRFFSGKECAGSVYIGESDVVMADQIIVVFCTTSDSDAILQHRMKSNVKRGSLQLKAKERQSSYLRF